MKEYFYERSKFDEFESNRLYHEVLSLNDEEFEDWARLLRKEVTEQWDGEGIPPVIGRDYDEIIESFGKLRSNECDFWHEDISDDEESLGIIKNFNKDASPVNQFFPTMLKTRISEGVSSDGARSIYDYFALPELEEDFVKVMKRAVRRDSMYAWSRSLTPTKDENPFWNGQTPYQFVKDVHDGRIFTGKWKNYDIVLSKTTKSAIKKYGKLNDEGTAYGNLFFLTPEQVRQLRDNGYLNSTQLINVGNVPSTKELKNGSLKKYLYNIRWYDKDEGLFPKLLQSFRLGLGQPAVNFPALTAKWIYENYTDHIEQDEPLHIYDSSSGWGGRILGAMSSRKDIHYIGTDPNPDTYIPELGMSRYEYVAKFFNENCVDNHSDTLKSFFEVESQANTYELFQDGSEKISENPDFQKYKGKLDLSFTSPPYFNREQYSQDENQSFKAYGEYDDWRDNFLRPTLTTIYEYLKNDRYILWNIADIKVGKSLYYPLEGDSIKILEGLGCTYEGKLKMLMTRMVGADANKRDSVSYSIKNTAPLNNKLYKYEPILVFHKP